MVESVTSELYKLKACQKSLLTRLPIDYLVVLTCLISHKDDTYADREVLHGFHFSGFSSVGIFSPDVECKLVVDGDNGTYFRCESKLPSCVCGSELSQIGF